MKSLIIYLWISLLLRPIGFNAQTPIYLFPTQIHHAEAHQNRFLGHPVLPLSEVTNVIPVLFEPCDIHINQFFLKYQHPFWNYRIHSSLPHLVQGVWRHCVRRVASHHSPFFRSTTFSFTVCCETCIQYRSSICIHTIYIYIHYTYVLYITWMPY